MTDETELPLLLGFVLDNDSCLVLLIVECVLQFPFVVMEAECCSNSQIQPLPWHPQHEMLEICLPYPLAILALRQAIPWPCDNSAETELECNIYANSYLHFKT